jgi:hypothetical protein
MNFVRHLSKDAGCVSGFDAEKKQIATGGKLAAAGHVNARKVGRQHFQLALGAIRHPNVRNCERPGAQQRPNQHATHAANANKPGIHSQPEFPL